MLSQSFPIRSADAMEASVAVTARVADSGIERAERARAMRMMGIYLEDAQGKRDEASSRRADQLTAVIRECVEILAANRRYDDPKQGPRPPLDALGLAIRYVDERLHANGKWYELGAELAAQTPTFRRRSRVYLRIRSRLRRAMCLVRRSA